MQDGETSAVSVAAALKASKVVNCSFRMLQSAAVGGYEAAQAIGLSAYKAASVSAAAPPATGPSRSRFVQLTCLAPRSVPPALHRLSCIHMRSISSMPC